METATGQLWERRQQRVSYETAVRLQPHGHGHVIEAQVTNLSPSGAFVSSDKLWDVGTELLCDLPLPHEPLRLKGRVAWVRPDRAPTGMGIEFVELAGSHRELLSRHLQAGPQEVSQLRIWFEGMGQPIRAEALPSVHGLQLRTALPFLRAGSTVRFAAEGQPAEREAMLGRTTLFVHPADPVPRLQVELHVKAEEPEALDAPTGASPTLELVGEEPQLLVLEVDVPRHQRITEPVQARQVCSGTIDSRDADEPRLEIVDESVEVSNTLRGQLLELKDDPYEAPPAVERSHWTFDDETQAAVRRAVDLADPLPGMDPITEDREFWQATGEGSRRWLWAAAMALMVVALASASYTGLFSRVGDALDAWLHPAAASPRPSARPTIVTAQRTAAAKTTHPAAKAAPPAPSSPRAAKPAPAARLVDALPKAAATAAPPAASTPVAKSPPSPPAASTPVAKPQPSPTAPRGPAGGYALGVGKDAVMMRFPLEGSIAGHQAYPLANPDGLAVKLPNARLALSRGLHPVGKAGIRTLWVRSLGKGVQLRVLFQQPSPRCQQRVTPAAIEVRCTPAAS